MNPPTKEMGKITTELTIANRGDQVLVERGYFTSDRIRSLRLDNVLVDTGATTLGLPSDAIAYLGLTLLREVNVETANGVERARIFRDASVSLCDREGTFECLELPGGTSPLLGVIPLEALGLEIDLKRQCLVKLPMNSEQTYLTIL